MYIPPDAHALTPEWLTAVLREHGVIENAVVRKIFVEKMDDKGVTTQLARLHNQSGASGKHPLPANV